MCCQDAGSGSEWEASDSEASESEAGSESDVESEEEEEEDLKGKGKGLSKGKKKGSKDSAGDKRRVGFSKRAPFWCCSICHKAISVIRESKATWSHDRNSCYGTDVSCAGCQSGGWGMFFQDC